MGARRVVPVGAGFRKGPGVRGGYRLSSSSIDVSPASSPSSRALIRRRMIFPERVFGSAVLDSIRRGAMAVPSRLRAKPISSRRSASLGSKPPCSSGAMMP
jgi:hypothetical protein